MKLSLVLATVGRSEDIVRFIQTLLEQTSKDFELIVVDQNSDDRLLPYLKKACQGGIEVLHLRLDRPSLAGARNLGIARATGQFVGFPDDDCWYEPDTVAQVLSAFSANPGLGGIVACWEEQMRYRNRDPQTGNLSLESWRNFRGGDASSISLFFRRELFDQIGGFDERFGVGCWYGAAEETDFILRALAHGVRINHHPVARVHHSFAHRVEDHSSCHKARQRSRGTGAIYGKHHLSLWVILRGFIAPVYHALHRKSVKVGIWTSFGRIEGYLRWRLRER